MITPEHYATRRAQFFARMIPNSIAILFAALETKRANDVMFPYYPNSNFLYLTGYTEPEAVAVFEKDRKGDTRFLLFNRDHDPVAEQWNGRRVGQEGAVLHFGADKAFSISRLEEEMPLLCEGKTRLYHAYGRVVDDDTHVMSWFNTIRKKMRGGARTPWEIIDIEFLLNEMRAIKDVEEIAIMEQSAHIACEATKYAIGMCRPGMYEYQLAAELHYIHEKHGAQETSFNTIVATGENSCILHYVSLADQLKDGEVVLIDSGCKYDHYVSDITRTIPVNGRFSEDQKAVYSIVLRAQLAGIEELRPNRSYYAAQEAVIRVITEGLCEIGILQGDVNTLIEQKAYWPFYMHYFSHWLGLETKDPTPYKEDGEWRVLKPGMVMSAECGIYIHKKVPGVDPRWWNIGIRIEDEVLITEHGNRVLTVSLPKTIEAIESLMNSSKE